MEKAILTCALTGVLTDPRQHPVPVTPQQMAAEARDAFNAGAAIMHVHLRQQGEGKGHLPSWDPDVAASIVDAIRAACPGVIINLTTGVVGPDISGPVACMGGMLRSGLEDSFYLPGGERAPGNGAMIEALARCARNAGREIASPAEARERLGLHVT
jgi:uncharacterized protein (DUF849 family)